MNHLWYLVFPRLTLANIISISTSGRMQPMGPSLTRGKRRQCPRHYHVLLQEEGGWKKNKVDAHANAFEKFKSRT